LTHFSIRSILDVRCICAVLAECPGDLYFDRGTTLDFIIDTPTNEPLLFRTGEREFHSFRVADIQQVIDGDAANRLAEPPDGLRFTVVAPTDADCWQLDMTELNALVDAGIKFALHTPSKMPARIRGIYYSYESATAIQRELNHSLSQLPAFNPIWVGKAFIPDVPHLATNIENRLLYERDEDYVAMLHQCSKIYVLDELGVFFIEEEGLTAEVIQ
jgi:hypothetical protein